MDMQKGTQNMPVKYEMVPASQIIGLSASTTGTNLTLLSVDLD